MQNQSRPTGARIGWRPAGPWTISVGQARLKIAAVWKAVFMLVEVERKSDADLFQVGKANPSVRPLFGLTERRKQQCGEQRDNGNHDQ